MNDILNLNPTSNPISFTELGNYIKVFYKSNKNIKYKNKEKIKINYKKLVQIQIYEKFNTFNELKSNLINTIQNEIQILNNQNHNQNKKNDNDDNNNNNNNNNFNHNINSKNFLEKNLSHKNEDFPKEKISENSIRKILISKSKKINKN